MQRGAYVGDVLKLLAEERGLKQKDLEEKTGIGHSVMSSYWSNRKALGQKNGERIARALGLEPDYFETFRVDDPALTRVLERAATIEEQVRRLRMDLQELREQEDAE